MSVVRIKNLITVSERDTLVEWIESNIGTDVFSLSGHEGTVRLTTRFSNNNVVMYPSIVYNIRDRIKKILDIRTDFYPSYPHGMVASYGLEEDECSMHTDPVWFDNHITYHCVLLLNSPESGGVPLINGQYYPMEELEGLYYPVSEVEHGTTKLIGNVPRLLWIFGFSIPKE